MSTLGVENSLVVGLFLVSPALPVLTLVYGARFILAATYRSHLWCMEQSTTKNKDVALKAYLSIVSNILCEHGRIPLCGADEVALVSNMYRSRKSYVDSVITVLILRQDCGYRETPPSRKNRCN